jgi:hypothetical protein
MCERCGQNKAAAKVQGDNGVQRLLCRPCVEAEQQAVAQQQQQQQQQQQVLAGAAPKIKIGTYKEPKDDKQEKKILERDWGLDKKKDKALPLAEKVRKLEAQLADIDSAIASEKKKKDGMDQLVGFYAKDPKQQKEVIAEIADLVKVIQTATEHRGLIAGQLLQCQQGNDPLNASAKRPGGHSAQPLPSAASVYRPTAKKNAALGKTWGLKQLPATLSDAQKVDALYQQLDELESAIATEVKGKQGLAVLAEQYRSSNQAQFEQISAELVGIDEDIKRLEAEANRVQADIVALNSPWKETVAPDGRKYYYHAETGETTWDVPQELKREKRKCEQCDERARLKVTGVDGVARWLCKAHGSGPRISSATGGSLSPRTRSSTAGTPTSGVATPPVSPPNAGGFAAPPPASFAAPPPAAFAPPPGVAAPVGRAPLQRHESTPSIALQRGSPGAMPGRGAPGGFAPPPAAAFAPPPAAAFAPPPAAAFAPPPAAGFAPPPAAGFAPPPAAGFAPPPARMGSSGFAPPPAVGGGGGGGAVPPGADSDPMCVGYARCHTRFVPEGEGELGIEVGEVICILSRDPDGWWKAKKNGRKGFVPSSFLENVA